MKVISSEISSYEKGTPAQRNLHYSEYNALAKIHPHLPVAAVCWHPQSTLIVLAETLLFSPSFSPPLFEVSILGYGMSHIIIAGVILIHIAFICYSVFIYKEHKYKRATKGLLVFITAAVIFDISATLCMIIGVAEKYFTLHGILGYSALLVMVTDAVFIWKHKNKYGSEVPFSKTLNRNSKLGYVLWLIAFFTGEMLAVMNHQVS